MALDLSKFSDEDLAALNALTQADFYFTLGNDSTDTPIDFNGATFSLKLALLINTVSKTDANDPTNIGLFKRIRPS